MATSSATPSTVKLWAGFNTAFVLSLVIIGTGALLTWLRRPVAAAQTSVAEPIRRLPSTDDAFTATIEGIDRVARKVTRYVQTGSLPTYLLVTLAVVVIVPMGVVVFVIVAHEPRLTGRFGRGRS